MIVISVSDEKYSSDISKRVEISKIIASFNTFILGYGSVVKTDDASPEGLVVFNQHNEVTIRCLVIVGDTDHRMFFS